jgi:hypothetical protein
MGVQGNKLRKNDPGDNSEDEEDESSQIINQILTEFAAVRSVVEKLFSFMNTYIFCGDMSALATVEQYGELKDLVLVNMLTTENFKVRDETGRQLKDIVVACSGNPLYSKTITAILKALLVDVLPTI